MTRKKFSLFGTSSMLAALLVTPAFAQTSAPAAEEESSEVVVTGTLIRGVAPVGTNVVNVGAEQIQQAGVASANNLLAAIPMLATFNTVAATPTTLGNNTARPNLRGLSVGQFDPVTTLLLIDGHNMVGSGILQTSPDPTLIPSGAIERVEVVPDGGSSMYGSDAVAGIINFITRKRYDGLLVETHGGFADHYWSSDLNLTTGRSWDSGSFVVSAMTRQNTELLAEYRDLPRQDLRPFGGSDNRVRTCNPATIQVGSTPYALRAGTPVFTGLTPGSFNLCDITADTAIVPKEHQNSIYASITQNLNDWIAFDMNGYWSNRLTKTPVAQINSAAVTINNTNPFFRSITGETSHTVSFNYGAAPTAGRRTVASSENSSWGATPTLTFSLPNDWEVKALYNYGRSNVTLHSPIKNAVAETNALRGTGLTTATALNPYDVTQTSQAVLTSILNFENYAGNIQELSQERIQASGPIFSLPGGQVRVAIGAQHSFESIDSLSLNAPPGVIAGAARKAVNKTVNSVFGEVMIPVVSPEMEVPFMHSLDLDFSGRYDDYSDFGETSNPKFGFTYEPVVGVSVRGSIGTSFNAPSLADTTGAVDSRVQVANSTNLTDLAPGRNNPAVDVLRPSLATPGGNPLLEPQTADTWSLGVDLRPEQVPGLFLSLTYWDAKLYHAIGTSTIARNVLFATPAYDRFYILYPTLQQALDAFGGNMGNLPIEGAVSLQAVYAGPPETWPYIFRDIRRNNLGNQYVNGLDFQGSYRLETGFGAINARVSGTRVLERNNQPFDGAPLVDLLSANASKLSVQGTLGVELGEQFTASATINYQEGFDVTGIVNQTHVDSFAPVNFFFKYDFPADAGITRDLSLTMNINNAFDELPPFRNSGNGIGMGSTLGRFVNVGVSKKF